MTLPHVSDFDLRGKRILLRLDLDVSVKERKVIEDARLQASLPTIKLLLNQRVAGIVLIGHRGRPGGRIDTSLSLSPIGEHLENLLVSEFGDEITKLNFFMMENLRFDPAECLPFSDSRAQEFAQNLSKQADFFINDSFSSAHRPDVSVVGLPKLLPHAAGVQFIKEVEALEHVLIEPTPPVVFILGGGKLDKALMVDKILTRADWVLVGGVLPKKISSYCREDGGGMCISAAKLTADSEDITPDSAQAFAEIIKDAGTIVWNGPMGDIDHGFWEGTEVVGRAVAENKDAFKVVGGGDSLRVLKRLGIEGNFDHISVAGGAMLEFLAYGDLPGIRALRAK